MPICASAYKSICYKCRVCIGPNVKNIRWFICGECNKVLGGVDVLPVSQT